MFRSYELTKTEAEAALDAGYGERTMPPGEWPRLKREYEEQKALDAEYVEPMGCPYPWAANV